MPSIQTTVTNDKGRQKFTIGEIARMILETHESSPSVKAQDVIMEIMKQAQDGGEPPVSFRHGIEPPDEEIVFVTAAGHPFKAAASAARAARTRADLQDIDWEIVSVDGGWVIREIFGYDNWFEYHAEETMTADEIGYMALVSTANMTRFCRSAAYREWASPLGLGVPVIFGGEGAPLANKKPAIKTRGRGGRKPGSGAYTAKDCVLWIEMKSVMGRGEATSVWDAAGQFAEKAPGATFDSKRRRLVKGYNDWISTQ